MLQSQRNLCVVYSYFYFDWTNELRPFAGYVMSVVSSGNVWPGTSTSLLSPWQLMDGPSCASFVYYRNTLGSANLRVWFECLDAYN